MFTLKKGTAASAELSVKRSRFIADLIRTDSLDEAREAIAAIRETYPDARHHCSAFIVAEPDQPIIVRSNDDGEPPKTAGPPILEVLQGAELVNVTAVVTRYFGGVLLGTGGLVRAYSDATAAALKGAQLVQRVNLTRVEVGLPLSVAGRVESEIHNRNWQILGSSWGEQLTLVLGLTSEQREELAELVADITRSPANISNLGQTTIEIAVPKRETTSTPGALGP